MYLNYSLQDSPISLDDCKQKCADNDDCMSASFDSSRGGNCIAYETLFDKDKRVPTS